MRKDKDEYMVKTNIGEMPQEFIKCNRDEDITIGGM